MSRREYSLTVVASLGGSAGALFWAFAEQPWIAGVCMALAIWASWRVFRCDVMGE